MRNKIIQWVLKIISLFISGVAWVARYGGQTPAGKARLGELYSLMRHWAHGNDAARIMQRYEIHRTVSWGLDTLIFGEGRITMGEHTYLGKNCFVLSHPAGSEIRIGRDCSISHNVHIRTARHAKEISRKDPLDPSGKGRNIYIGDSVLIGANAFIRGGVTIGEGSIIGANSVVTSDVPSHSVVGGVPARPIYPISLSENAVGKSQEAGGKGQMVLGVKEWDGERGG